MDFKFLADIAKLNPFMRGYMLDQDEQGFYRTRCNICFFCGAVEDHYSSCSWIAAVVAKTDMEKICLEKQH